jgi:hypothetical protein
MLKARPAKEIIVKMPNEIGALDRMAKTISDKGANLLAVTAWVEGADAVIRLVTDDTSRVMDTLKAHDYAAREADVLVVEVPHKPGMLRRITSSLAEGGIDIHHLYATAPTGLAESMVVFASANNDRAMVLLNGSRWA